MWMEARWSLGSDSSLFFIFTYSCSPSLIDFSLIDVPTGIPSSPLCDLSHPFYFHLLKVFLFHQQKKKKRQFFSSSPYYSCGDFSEIKVQWILNVHRTQLQPSIKQVWATCHLLLSIFQCHDLFNSHSKPLIGKNLFLSCRHYSGTIFSVFADASMN